MGKLQTLLRRNRFALFFWVGAVLLVLGLGIWWYADSVIRGHEQILTGNLNPQERARVSGSLSWWRIAQITLYNPISLVLITIGILCMVYAFAWMAMQPIQIVK